MTTFARLSDGARAGRL